MTFKPPFDERMSAYPAIYLPDGTYLALVEVDGKIHRLTVSP